MLLYDNAMLAVNYQMAAEYGVRWILGGTNTTTEGMEMPANWNWFKFDKKNILALAKRKGVEIDTFPSIGTLGYVFSVPGSIPGAMDGDAPETDDGGRRVAQVTQTQAVLNR